MIESEYKKYIEQYTVRRDKKTVQRNVLTVSKLLLFALFIWSIYLLLESYHLWKVAAMVAEVIAFAILTKIDSDVHRSLRLYNAMIDCCSVELEYLSGEFSKLDKGERYISAEHPYSHDLDIFGEESLFCSVNRGITGRGADRLASLLSQQIPDSSETITERQRAVLELKDRPEWRLLFRATGMCNPISESDIKYINEWREEPLFFKSDTHKYLLYASNTIMALFIAGAFFDSAFITIAGSWFIVQLLTAMFYNKKILLFSGKLGKFVSSAGNYFHLIKLLKSENFESELLNNIKSDLFEKKDSIKAFRSLKRIFGDIENRANLLGFLVMNGLYIRDLHLMSQMDVWKGRNIDDIGRWIEAVSEVDAVASISNYSFNHPDYTFPKFTGELIIDAVSMSHPLIGSEAIPNNFKVEKVHDFSIITGANMAGKSTFLRTVGVNMVLAYAGSPVCAERLTLTCIPLFTSMRTTDNLSKGTSYFHAELLRLKKLVERASQGTPLFIILDEMLKGTNSHDKLNGSLKFLVKLLDLSVSGIIATHDLALGELADSYPSNFRNLCFEIDNTEDGIIYDYKLKKGISKNMNASILLEKMGLI